MDAPSPPNDPQMEASFAGMTASFAVPTAAVAGEVATAAIEAYERTGTLGRVAISTCVPATQPVSTEAPGSFAAPTASFAAPTARSATEIATASIAALERSGMSHMGALSTYVPATPPRPCAQESTRSAPEPGSTTSPETACAARHVCLELLGRGSNRSAERVFNTLVLKDIDDTEVTLRNMLAFRFAAAPGILPGFTESGFKMLRRLENLRARYEQRSGAAPGEYQWMEAVKRASPDAKWGMRLREDRGNRAPCEADHGMDSGQFILPECSCREPACAKDHSRSVNRKRRLPF